MISCRASSSSDSFKSHKYDSVLKIQIKYCRTGKFKPNFVNFL